MNSIHNDLLQASSKEVEQFIREYFSLAGTCEILATEWEDDGYTQINLALRNRFELGVVWWAKILIRQDASGTTVIKELDIESIQASFYKSDQLGRERVIYGYGENLNKLYKKILEKFGEAENVARKPIKPAKPKRGSSVNAFFDWYHAMLDNGFNCSLEEIAKETNHNAGYIRQLHARYANERGLSDKTSNKN